jgi:penicillin amidase
LGWDATHDWQGYADPQHHPRALNPADGLIVTANQDLNDWGKVRPMTLPMSSYRADRVRQLLLAKDKLTPADMQHIHYDRYSLQAEAFMPLLRPLLPDTKNGRILQNWDLRYDADSLGATLFDRVYDAYVNLLFGEQGVGAQVMAHVMHKTGLFAMLHGNFDRVLLQESGPWFGEQGREALLRQAVAKGLAEMAVPHAQTRRVTIHNLFFGGQLPQWLGYDYTFAHIGSRATIPQSQIFEAAGRPTSFAASLRLICDMAKDEIHLNLPGGASDRRFSKYYTSGIKNWENGVYEVWRP